MLCEAAHHYRKAGLCVLPAIRAEKRPAIGAWKRYQDRLPTEAEVLAWLSNPRDALCMLCGAVSNQLEMIDFDAQGELFLAWLDRIPKELANRLVIESTPSGGMHVVYRCDVPICGNLKLAQRKTDASGGGGKIVTLIETRGQGGLFLCAPTSGYELVQGDMTALPVLTAEERDLLLQAAWEMNEYVPPVVNGSVTLSNSSAPAPASSTSPSSVRPGDDFNQRGDPRKILRQHGWSLAKPGSSGGNEYWRRPDKETGWSASLKDGVFYVFSANAAPFEPHQAYSPFAVCALLEHGGDYALAASALRMQGYGTPLQIASEQGVSLAGLIDPPDMLEHHGPRPFCEMAATYPRLRKPIIHGLLREGETMNVIAAPKMGKSWLVTDLALSVVTGRDWLGMYPCEQGQVLILDNELHGETIVNRVPKVAQARDIAPEEYGNDLWIDVLRGKLKDVFSLGGYFSELKPGQYKLIILDAFYRFMPRDMDENDNGTMASLYNQIDRYADELGCSFVLIHHTTKGNQSAKSVTDVGAGAGSQSRATDTHVILRPHEEEDVMVMDAAVRSWAPASPFCLRREFPVWMPADDLDPYQLRSENGKKRAEKKEVWTPEMFVTAFIDHIPTPRAGVIAKAVSANMSRWSADNLLRAADKQNLIAREGTGGRSSSYLYSLPSSQENRS